MDGKLIPPLNYTGERMVPEAAHAVTLWQHIYRYKFAARFAAGRDILDIACGEGYGTATLRAVGARSVIGVDIDPASCAHARAKYGVDARVADAARLPLADDSFDLVVSFETIEHVPEPRRMVEECYRVLRPGGQLMISTPNTDVYNSDDKKANPFHCSEMTEREFTILLRARFVHLKMYSQHLVSASPWSARAMATDQSPWLKIRGFGRFRRNSQVYQPTATANARMDPIGTILRRHNWLDRLVNPYFVRRRSEHSGEVATYFVCVARSTKG